jgi:hypothetical protein
VKSCSWFGHRLERFIVVGEKETAECSACGREVYFLHTTSANGSKRTTTELPGERPDSWPSLHTPHPAVATPVEVTELHGKLRSFLERERSIAAIPQTMVDAGIDAYKRETRCDMSKGLMRVLLSESIAAYPHSSYSADSCNAGTTSVPPITDADNPWRRAVEHAGYLVAAVERYRIARNEECVAYDEVENADDATDDQVAALDHAQEECSEASNVVRDACYEFTKRRDRAMATLDTQRVAS